VSLGVSCKHFGAKLVHGDFYKQWDYIFKNIFTGYWQKPWLMLTLPLGMAEPQLKTNAILVC